MGAREHEGRLVAGESEDEDDDDEDRHFGKQQQLPPAAHEEHQSEVHRCTEDEKSDTERHPLEPSHRRVALQPDIERLQPQWREDKQKRGGECVQHHDAVRNEQRHDYCDDVVGESESTEAQHLLPHCSHDSVAVDPVSYLDHDVLLTNSNRRTGDIDDIYYTINKHKYQYATIEP